MGSLVFDYVKAEKIESKKKYCRRRKLVELCLALIVLFFTFSPFNYHISGDYIRQLFSAFNTTFYVFVLSNVIIFTVAISFKNFAGGSCNGGLPDIYEEFVSHSEYLHKAPSAVISSGETMPEVDCLDKQIVFMADNAPAVSGALSSEERVYRRTKSENLDRRIVEKPIKELRRSETEVRRKVKVSATEAPSIKAVEEMNSEEFRLKIEAFIATQKWHQKQEEIVTLPSPV